MTTRADYHIDTANEFLTKAHAYLAEGDLLQASEKGWGATARMVKAVAETRGWRHSSHGDLYRAIDDWPMSCPTNGSRICSAQPARCTRTSMRAICRKRPSPTPSKTSRRSRAG